MSLDITAFSRARFVHNDDECEADDHHHIWSLPEFVSRLDGMEMGCYASDGKEMGFGAGLYSGYNKWRELLSLVALNASPEVVWENEEEYAGKSFVELIYMADSKGAIGHTTSKKLATDFEALGNTVEQKLREVIKQRGLDRWFDEQDIHWWLKKYDEWHKAFVLASDDGFVVFH